MQNKVTVAQELFVSTGRVLKVLASLKKNHLFPIMARSEHTRRKSLNPRNYKFTARSYFHAHIGNIDTKGVTSAPGGNV